MIHQTQFCTCEECRRGDALPLRRHGIPGARQLSLVVPRDVVFDGQGNGFELVEMTAEEIASWRPRGPQRGLEGLGLFDPGSADVNQPSLF